MGSTKDTVVSYPSAVAPSNCKALAPANVPLTVITSDAASPKVTLPFNVVAPVTVKSPPTVSCPAIATVELATVELGVIVTWVTYVP